MVYLTINFALHLKYIPPRSPVASTLINFVFFDGTDTRLWGIATSPNVTI